MKCDGCQEQLEAVGLQLCPKCVAALPPVRSEPLFALPIVVLDAHNDELEIREVYMVAGKELVIATNAESEQ